MDRRAAAALIATAVLGGCGGGGGGGAAGGTASAGTALPAPAPAPPPAPAPAPAFVGSANIAVWGDSMVPGVAAHLQLLYPGRVVYDGGVVGQTSSQIAARQLADASGRNTWVNVFWYGHNNQDEPEQIKADIAASVAALAPGNNRFVVMSLVNQATPEESRGAPAYQVIIQLNNELAALYSQNYLDIRSFLVSQYDPASAQDVADFNNDVPPLSLRYDQIHQNDAGATVVAAKLREYIDAKGW